MTLLRRFEDEAMARRDELRRKVRVRLEAALAELLPGQAVVVFGSLAQSGTFHARSDVDLAVFDVPEAFSEWSLQAALEDRLQRPVDLVRLPDHRLNEKIRGSGEMWII